MGAEIAVHLGESGHTASLYQKGKIAVYRKNMGRWTLLREMDFTLDSGLGLREAREKMREVTAFLDGCHVFVGLNVSGVPYFELEKSGIGVWEFEGTPLSFLDSILEKEEADQVFRDSREKAALPVPEEISGGCYRISIKKIQEENSGITSKQVLLPFIRRGGFYSLEILCSHVPPWLEAEIKGGSLSGDITDPAGGGAVVTIRNKCCV
jgi:Fe-only nitrogenase accessory protein AnfO